MEKQIKHPLKIENINLINRKVIKRNELIEAHFDLSLMEQKMICLFACMVSATKDPFNSYFEISSKDFCHIVGVTNTCNYKPYTKSLIKKLMSRPSFTIGHSEYNWVASCEYRPRGIISFEFPERLIPYLQSCAQGLYTTYYLSNILPLKHKYSPRIYELCRQYYPLIKKREFELKELRNILGLEDHQYPTWQDLKAKILQPCLDELYAKTDIGCNLYIAGKYGKLVTRVGLTIFTGKMKANRKEALKEAIIRANKSIKEGNHTSSYTARMNEYYRDLPNYPENRKPTFAEYLEFMGMRIVKAKQKGLKLDVQFIPGSQGELDFFSGREIKRLSFSHS